MTDTITPEKLEEIEIDWTQGVAENFERVKAALLSALEAEKKRADEAEQKRKCFECDSELMACALCNPELASVELTRLRARVVELERAATFLLSEIDAHQDYDSIVEATSGIRTAIKGDGQ